jgi:hypothetical protein
MDIGTAIRLLAYKIFMMNDRQENHSLRNQFNYFFLRVSTVVVILIVVSFFTIAVSGVDIAGVTTVVVSELLVSSVFLAESLHAVKEIAIIAIANNFFIVVCLFNLKL